MGKKERNISCPPCRKWDEDSETENVMRETERH
jgi:hypothetical protein